MDTQALQKRLEELEKKVKLIDEKRIFQQDVVPDAIKMRAMGEANRFVRFGVASDKPTVGETSTDSTAMYYDSTAHKLWVYDNGTWKYAQFS